MVDTAMDEQIVKFKARRSKKRLSYYGFALSLMLTLSALSQGFTIPSLLVVVLLLPLPLYFGLQSFKFHRKSQLYPLTSDSYDLTPTFSLVQFLSQPNWAFRVSLILFFLTCFVTLARLTATPTLLTMIP